MLGALTGACLGIVLLPGEASVIPRLGHRPHQILSQRAVQLVGSLLMRPLGLCKRL
jgi:hypothetical protein